MSKLYQLSQDFEKETGYKLILANTAKIRDIFIEHNIDHEVTKASTLISKLPNDRWALKLRHGSWVGAYFDSNHQKVTNWYRTRYRAYARLPELTAWQKQYSTGFNNKAASKIMNFSPGYLHKDFMEAAHIIHKILFEYLKEYETKHQHKI